MLWLRASGARNRSLGAVRGGRRLSVVGARSAASGRASSQPTAAHGPRPTRRGTRPSAVGGLPPAHPRDYRARRGADHDPLLRAPATRPAIRPRRVAGGHRSAIDKPRAWAEHGRARGLARAWRGRFPSERCEGGEARGDVWPPSLQPPARTGGRASAVRASAPATANHGGRSQAPAAHGLPATPSSGRGLGLGLGLGFGLGPTLALPPSIHPG